MHFSNLRYNLFMKFGRISHSLANTVRQILHSVADSHVTGTESSPLERPLGDGSEMMGDYNFRTGKIDCGTDPFGWYEDQ